MSPISMQLIIYIGKYLAKKLGTWEDSEEKQGIRSPWKKVLCYGFLVLKRLNGPRQGFQQREIQASLLSYRDLLEN